MVDQTPRNMADDAQPAIVSPSKFAHVVLRSSRYEKLVSWYKTLLGARASYEDDKLAFLTYDDEHHRIAILNLPGLRDKTENAVGVDHVAFTYPSLGALLATYERLKAEGIEPFWTINHGPTTSLYFRDPDGNQVEFQVENFSSEAESAAFFASSAFAENPIGVEFSPEDLTRRLYAGEPEHLLLQRPNNGPRGLDSIPLR
ncbi:MAG: biphenyl 2,3-dioxygenase [Sphingomonas bacterium]|jgi:catechol 2,3-dioxygenase-like lactoylglutathione lyase family enzyme|uniref:VOC family protein n=1 Tax=Sphingomonas bacterium TaxID=1895847 RepID=UPI00260CF5E6|nr:VOC family protein [Sphingomonas bacterium]MDB5710734.1 biphenyl 2,3-dioxygenase [Sphingomonas bacterium]